MRYGLIDGYNMAFRAFYGMPELTRKDGFPTGALHGWVRSLWWIEDHVELDRLLVFFDLGGAKRQTDLRSDYKANRGETPEALEQQVPVIKEWTRAGGYIGIERDGIEADDLIASAARQCRDQGDSVLIISADKDLAQLVGEGVHQLVPPPTANPRLGWKELDSEGVRAKFGINAAQVADYLALIGDTADNIPGLKGVGPKTAAKWLQQYGTLEGVIAHSGELMPKRFQQQVYAEAESLRCNLQMTRLDTELPVTLASATEPDRARALEILREMEMGKTADAYAERLERA
jgi:DNA polymerase-1